MKKNTYLILVSVFCLLLCALCLMFFFPASFGTFFLIGIFSLGLLVTFVNSFQLRIASLALFLLLFFAFASVRIKALSIMSFGVDLVSVDRIEGKVVYDSSFSQKGNHVMTLSLSKVHSIHGIETSAKGLITVVGKEEAVIASGTKVSVAGTFTEDMFIASEILVLENSVWNRFRVWLIERISFRIIGNEDDNAAILSVMLILGRSDANPSFPLTQKAKDCGCLHVLALSGMHLQILVSFCLLFGQKKGPRLFSWILIGLFLFVAGPRPSLLRAAFMFCLRALPFGERLLGATVLQTFIFPLSMVNIGCAFGYLAVAGLFLLSPYLNLSLSMVLPKALSRTLSSTWAALLFCLPLQLLQDGKWYPVSFVAGPVSSLFCTVSMALGFALLVFGRMEFLVKANELIFSSLDQSLEFFSSFPSASFAFSWVFLFLSFVVISIPFVWRKRMQQT